MSNHLFKNYLTVPWKSEYVKQVKDPNKCIFCAIAKKNRSVEAWEVYRDELAMIVLNKFPYNPGHLLIVPLDHYENFESIPANIASHLTSLIQKSIILLKKTHNPQAFNVGLNIGVISGASIKHLHWHIVPRYSGDLNFLEMLNTRVLVETLPQTLAKLIKEREILLK